MDYHTLTRKIEAIDSRLESGVESVSTDGTSTKVTIDGLRAERKRLIEQRAKLHPSTTRRPVASRIDLGGF